MFSAPMLNQKLEHMGWEAQILDNLTYNLIMFCFEIKPLPAKAGRFLLRLKVNLF